MEHFALASVYPRSIAWLIRSDEWERFEEIVKYNCAMVGGYFNVFIPLTPEDTLSENHQHFLIDYDPDLIVLAPGMKPEYLDTLHSHLHPFAIIPWRSVSQVATLDPWGGLSGTNVTLGAAGTLRKENSPMQTFVAVSDILPEEALDLLVKGILERGFVLRCTSCSYRSWYPAEHVGQTFECTRCFQIQIYRSNPLWLYKLPEVIFQGFEDNMQVPLLALHHLKGKSQHSFEWVPDSDVYWVENSNEIHKNVDILCLCDGKLYIGEAKSSDEIEPNQFSFYEDICRRVAIDGVVFATSKPQWKRATLQRIEQLKNQFSGEVLVLTGQDLYPVTPLS